MYDPQSLFTSRGTKVTLLSSAGGSIRVGTEAKVLCFDISRSPKKDTFQDTFGGFKLESELFSKT